jgi:hypothetical protein
MDPRLAGELAKNQGLVTRQRAWEIGVDRAAFDRLVRTDELVGVRRGVYCLPDVLATAPTLGARQRLHDRAACLRVPQPFVRSHTSAALELGLGILLPPRPLTHVTQRRHGIRTCWGVKHHVAPYREDQVVEANGFRVLDGVRTAIDIAREYGHPYGVVAIDRVRWLGHPLSELEEIVAVQMRSWPHVNRARRELDLSSAGAESVAETLGRDLLEEMGLTDIETQFGLTDGRRTHFADLRVGRQLIEIDGELKYIEAPGLAGRSIESVLVEEKNRESWFRGFHLGVSRLTWRDVYGAGRVAAKQRLRREIDQTDRLWGTSIDDLERFRVRRRRPA